MSIHDGQAEGVDKLDDPFPVVIQETVMCDNERLGTRGPEGLCHIVQVLYLQGWTCTPNTRAVASTAWRSVAAVEPAFLSERWPTRAMCGNASFSSSRRFPASSSATLMKPVILPPGCARLVMSPKRTGSSFAPIMTMGMVLVACLAA